MGELCAILIMSIKLLPKTLFKNNATENHFIFNRLRSPILWPMVLTTLCTCITWWYLFSVLQLRHDGLHSFEHLSIWSGAIGDHQPSPRLYHILLVQLRHFSLTLRIRTLQKVMTIYHELVRQLLSKNSFWNIIGI